MFLLLLQSWTSLYKKKFNAHISLGTEEELPGGLRGDGNVGQRPDAEGGSHDGGHVRLGAEHVDRQLEFRGCLLDFSQTFLRVNTTD